MNNVSIVTKTKFHNIIKVLLRRNKDDGQTYFDGAHTLRNGPEGTVTSDGDGSDTAINHSMSF